MSVAERFAGLALECMTQEKYKDALEYAGNALVQSISVHGLKSSKTAESHLILGRIYLMLKDYDSSLIELRVSRTIFLKLNGEKSLDVATCDFYIGAVEQHQQHFQVAFHFYFVSWYKRALLLGINDELSKRTFEYVTSARQQVSPGDLSGTTLSSPSSSPLAQRRVPPSVPSVAVRSEDRWMHLFEVLDRVVELQWRRHDSSSMTFRLAVALQFGLSTDSPGLGPSGPGGDRGDAACCQCFLQSRLRVLVQDTVLKFVHANGSRHRGQKLSRHGMPASFYNEDADGSDSDDGAEAISSDSDISSTTSGSDESPEDSSVTVTSSVEAPLGSMDDRTIDVDATVRNVMRLLLSPTPSKLTCEHLLTQAYAAAKTLTVSPATKPGGGHHSDSAGAKQQVTFSSPPQARPLSSSQSTKSPQIVLSPGFRLNRYEDEDEDEHDERLHGEVENSPNRNSGQEESNHNSDGDEVEDYEENEDALGAITKHISSVSLSAVVSPLNLGKGSALVDAEPAIRTSAAPIILSRSQPLPLKGAMHADAAPVSQAFPSAKSRSEPSGNVRSPPVAQHYPESVQQLRVGSGGSSRGGIMSLEVARLNQSWSQRALASLPSSSEPYSSSSASLSVDELLRRANEASEEAEKSAKAKGSVGGPKASIADELAGGDWRSRRMPFRLLDHQTYLETLDSDGRCVVVRHKSADSSHVSTASAGKSQSHGQKITLTPEQQKQRLLSMSATLCTAWLRALPIMAPAAAAAAVRAATAVEADIASGNVVAVGEQARRVSTIARRLSVLDAAMVKSESNAAKSSIVSSREKSDGKSAAAGGAAKEVTAAPKIPRPPPLPSAWPPLFDEKHNLITSSGGTSSVAGAFARASASSPLPGTPGAKAVVPPKVKQVQWDSVASVEGTLWEDASIEELVDTQALFADVEKDFSNAPPKPKAAFGRPAGGMPGKAMFSPAELLSKSKGLSAGAGAGKESVEGGSRSAASKEKSLIDAHRAQNINIMLAKFSRIKMEDLARAVLHLDVGVLDVSAISALQQFIPTVEEGKLLAKHVSSASEGATAPLGKAEKYLWEMSKVPKVEQRLSVMWFCLSLRETINSLEHSSQIMFTATNEVRGSVRLKCILKVILELGNVLKNDGVVVQADSKTPSSSGNSCAGFRFSSLSKATQTKSNKGENVLEYVVNRLNTVLPEMLQVDGDMKTISEAARLSLPKLALELAKLTSGLETLKEIYSSDKSAAEAGEAEVKGKADKSAVAEQSNILPAARLQRLQEMIGEFAILINTATQNLQSATKDFEDLCVYLGEPIPDKAQPSSTSTPEILFGHLQTFIKNVETATNAASARARRQARVHTQLHSGK